MRHQNLLRLVKAGLGGWLIFTSFAPLNWPVPLALIGAALGIHSIQNSAERWTALTASVFSLSFFLPLLAWLSVVGTDAWIAVGLICSAWWVLAFTLSQNRSAFWLALAITAAELARDRIPWGGFGWGQAGILWVNSGYSKGILSLIGQVGATLFFWWLAATLSHWRIRRTLISVALASLVGGISLSVAAASSQPDSTELVLIQGGVDHVGLGTLGNRRAVLERHIKYTKMHLSDLETADLVVWPENASDVDPNTDQVAQRDLESLSKQISSPLWLGAVINRSDTKVANVLLRYQSGKSEEVYAKQRLVPFGEFLPLREFLSAYTDRTSLMPRDFEPGIASYDEVVNNSRIGNLICFEVADDNLAWDRSAPLDGLVVQTNNATYDASAQSEQQTLYARTRAIEMSIPVFVVSTNGQSSVINNRGEVEGSILQGETGLLKGYATTNSDWTLAARLHDSQVMAILTVGIFQLLTSRRRVRS